MDPECYINADVIAVEGLTRLPMHCKRNRRTRCSTGRDRTGNHAAAADRGSVATSCSALRESDEMCGEC